MTDQRGQLGRRYYELDNQDPDSTGAVPRPVATHIFNSSLIWMLPALEDRSGSCRTILGDWEIATIVGAGHGPAADRLLTGRAAAA